MIFQCLSVGQLQANCYIVGDEDSKEVVVIDPGDEYERIYDYIQKEGYQVRYIIATHAHVDHISAMNRLKQVTGANTVVHEADNHALSDSKKNLSIVFGQSSIQGPADRIVNDGDVLQIGNYTLQFMHTPGHTPGGVCILLDRMLFSGDTLFKGSIGRTDLPGGNFQQLIQSVKNKLIILDEDIIVYPGHGPNTSIGEEKMTNPYLMETLE